jgi:hypothetical protein
MFVVLLNAMIEVRVGEDCCVFLLYFGVPEEYSSMQSAKRSIVGLFEVSSCYPCLLQFPINNIHGIEGYVFLECQHYFYVSAGSRSTYLFRKDG